MVFTTGRPSPTFGFVCPPWPAKTASPSRQFPLSIWSSSSFLKPPSLIQLLFLISSRGWSERMPVFARRPQLPSALERSSALRQSPLSPPFLTMPVPLRLGSKLPFLPHIAITFPTSVALCAKAKTGRTQLYTRRAAAAVRKRQQC